MYACLFVCVHIGSHLQHGFRHFHRCTRVAAVPNAADLHPASNDRHLQVCRQQKPTAYLVPDVHGERPPITRSSPAWCSYSLSPLLHLHGDLILYLLLHLHGDLTAYLLYFTYTVILSSISLLHLHDALTAYLLYFTYTVILSSISYFTYMVILQPISSTSPTR